MKLEEVENLPITEYRTRLWMCFNCAALESGFGEFKFQTEDEEFSEAERLIDYYRKKGVLP